MMCWIVETQSTVECSRSVDYQTKPFVYLYMDVSVNAKNQNQLYWQGMCAHTRNLTLNIQRTYTEIVTRTAKHKDNKLNKVNINIKLLYIYICVCVCVCVYNHTYTVRQQCSGAECKGCLNKY